MEIHYKHCNERNKMYFKKYRKTLQNNVFYCHLKLDIVKACQ